VVPVVINRYSKNILDVKDFVLVVGVAAGLSVWLLTSLARGRIEWAQGRLNIAAFCFVVWACGTLVYSKYRYASAEEIQGLLAHAGFYFLVVAAIKEFGQVRRLLGAAAISAMVVCAYAFMQAAGMDPLGWDERHVRVFSFLGNATYLAGYCVLLLPLLIAVGWPEKLTATNGSKWLGVRSIFFLTIAALLVLCLYFTISLSPTIGLGLGVALASMLAVAKTGLAGVRKNIHIILPALIILAGLLLFGYRALPERQQRRVGKVLNLQDPYGKERQLIRQAGYDIFRKHPVLGTGYGTYRIYALEILAPHWYTNVSKNDDTMLVTNYAHNEYIQVLAGTGVIGGALFFGLIALLFYRGIWNSLMDPRPEWRRLSLAITVGAVAFLFQQAFGVTFRQPGTVTFFWLSAGLLTVAGAGIGKSTDEGIALRTIRFRALGVFPLLGIGSVMVFAFSLLTWSAVKPVRAGGLLKRAEWLAKRGGFREGAILADKAIELYPYSPQAYYVAAYAWGSLGDHKRSLEANKRSLELLPGNASVYYNLGVNYKKLGMVKEAEKNLLESIRLMPNSKRHHAALAEVLLENGEYDRALFYAKEAVRLAPKNPKTHLLAADIEARRGNLEAAAEYLCTAARRSPKDPNIWQQLADIRFKQRKTSEALKAAKRWAKLEPDSAEAQQLLAACNYNAGRYSQAATALRRLLELRPDNSEARLRLAYSYIKLQKMAKARRELHRLATNDPTSPQGVKAVELLRTLPARPR